MTNKQISYRELSQFCSEYSMILKSGFSGEDGLSILLEDADEKTKETFSPVLNTLQETGSLSSSLKENSSFPEDMISYVKVGEETGCLDEIMESLSKYYESQNRLRSYIKSAISYPILMLCMMVFIISILLAKVLPVFSQVFQQMGLELTPLSKGFLSIGNSLGRFSLVFIAILFLIIFFTIWVSFTQKGKESLTYLGQTLPYLKKISLAISYSRLTFGISLGIRSGLGVDGGISLATILNKQKDLQPKLDFMKERLEEGFSLEEVLSDISLFDAMSTRLICVASRAGSEEEIFEDLSKRYEESAMEQIQKIISAIEPTIVIVLSAIVGIVLLSVMMPLLGILSEMMM